MYKIAGFLIVAILLSACNKTDTLHQRDLALWYTQPAQTWTEALPVGNGRLGAMVFGDTDIERIQLNEESVWTGGPIDRANPEALEYLDEVRNLLFQGKYAEAEKLAQKKIMAKRLDYGHSYQTLGDMYLKLDDTGDVSNYKRTLDLRKALNSVQYVRNNILYNRELFSSAPDNAIVVRLSADKPGSISLTAWMNRPGNADTISVEDNQIHMNGFAEYKGMGTHFTSIVDINNSGGEVVSTDSSLEVRNADEVLIFITARTDFWGDDEVKLAEEDIKQIIQKDYKDIKEDHIKDYQLLFNRVDLALNDPDTLDLPTDVRLERIKDGAVDPHFTELYFQYGRYLLISSSRPGGLPANLQGIWAKSLTPPWKADYHININLQMNYWPALVTNLAECQQPYFDFIEGLRKRGRITAKETYDCRGFVAHHTTDVWKFTDPIGMTYWGLWPMGAAWCSDHFWEHYDFTGDRQFLENTAYPVLKEAAMFFMDYLVENPKTGLLVSGPSMSPENNFLTAEGERASICMGPAMDHQIIRELFTNCIRSTEILDIDQGFADSLRILLDRLTPSKIGSDGRILEWSEELEEAEPGHRHISHLYALYPGDEFAKPGEKWMAAARKTIDTRLANGGGHTGWSRAWIINFFARLQDGEKAHENLQALYARSTHPNLFDNHPPFQIDGNFGGTAGITEMLMQSQLGVIQILPALPKDWQSGEVTGLRVRGGYIVDIEWEAGKLKKLNVKSLMGNPVKIKYGGQVVEANVAEGETAVYDHHLVQQ